MVNETILREIFSQFGKVADVTIKQHNFIEKQERQAGYGFVYFFAKKDALTAVSILKNKTLHDVMLDCSFCYETDVPLRQTNAAMAGNPIMNAMNNGSFTHGSFGKLGNLNTLGGMTSINNTIMNPPQQQYPTYQQHVATQAQTVSSMSTLMNAGTNVDDGSSSVQYSGLNSPGLPGIPLPQPLQIHHTRSDYSLGATSGSGFTTPSAASHQNTPSNHLSHTSGRLTQYNLNGSHSNNSSFYYASNNTSGLTSPTAGNHFNQFNSFGFNDNNKNANVGAVRDCEKEKEIDGLFFGNNSNNSNINRDRLNSEHSASSKLGLSTTNLASGANNTGGSLTGFGNSLLRASSEDTEHMVNRYDHSILLD